MPPGLGPRLRFLLGKFHEDFDPVAAEHPEIRLALENLGDEVRLAFPPAPLRPRKRKAGRQKMLNSTKAARLASQLKWARKQRRLAEVELAKLKAVKNAEKKNRMAPPFIAKVALSQPSACARAFAGAWRDLVGIGAEGCSRTTIGRIRDAFAEVCKQMCHSQVRFAAEAARKASVALATPQQQPIFCAAVLHIHDEASLRLRSASDVLPGVPGRSRNSKVQQHCVWLHLHSQLGVRWLVELDPLADKTGATLATSLERVVRPLGQIVGEAFASDGALRPPIWLVHFLVGDGASSNEAAAKILLSSLRRDRLQGGVVYFLAVVKCANHQANLAVSSVVVGRAATVGASSSAPIGADVTKHAGTSVCGAITRLFKFLVSDYEAEFAANLSELAAGLRACRHSPVVGAERQRWEGLRELYGESVVPGPLLEILNSGLSEWAHAVDDPAALAPGRLDELRDNLLRILRKRILVVDEKPTMTRMFTFSAHMDCLLLLHFLQCAPALVKMRGSQPRKRSRLRVTKVLAFMSRADAGQYLRRSSLALQLVSHVNALCAQLHMSKTPVLVRLSQGAAHRAIANDFAKLVCSLHLDTALDHAAAFSLLLATSLEVGLRFDQYLAWPCAAWRLCQRYNGDGFVAACMEFLVMPEDRLDIGFGAPLRQAARLAGEREVDRLRWLMSAPVQAALVQVFEASAASSLPVERAFAETKRSEAPRLCHVATAGRNQLIKHFLRQREVLLKEATDAAALLRQATSANLQSLAWELKPDLLGNGTEMRKFIADRRPQLQEELRKRKEKAKAAMAKTSDATVPVIEGQWVAWFEAHEDEFQERMKTVIGSPVCSFWPPAPLSAFETCFPGVGLH